jgi:hypothetical protein
MRISVLSVGKRKYADRLNSTWDWKSVDETGRTWPFKPSSTNAHDASANNPA